MALAIGLTLAVLLVAPASVSYYGLTRASRDRVDWEAWGTVMLKRWAKQDPFKSVRRDTPPEDTPPKSNDRTKRS